ncbi:MAG: hypothetical protein JZU58_08740 [Curvibacter lanceolatus]|uniref:hypothetical protein n=1 Tax=Curvibacter lanceolatus TaxID=86182 RepID=UPI0023536B40|nr:hypothetical protein [Curvibacter lanceolatus]MBV5292429.1 hypothetical protein [Curvibacter lanceolatus]
MKSKLIIFMALFITASSSFSQTLTKVANTTLNIANQSYANPSALNAALNGATNAAERAGQAATSAASAVARSNLARAAAGGAAAGIPGGLVGVVGGVAVGLLLDYGLGKIMSNADGTVSLTNKTANQSVANAFGQGSLVWTLANAGDYTGKVESSSIESLLPLYIKAQNYSVLESDPYYVLDVSDCAVSGNQYFCQTVKYQSKTMQNRQYVGYRTYANSSCSTGFIFNGTACSPDPSATLGEQTQIVQMKDLLDKLTPEEKSAPVSPADLSNMTNALIQSLNDSGYQNAPLTNASDFSNAKVTVEEALTPITQAQVSSAATPATATNASPSTTATTSTSTTTTTDPATGAATTTVNVNAKVDLGSDPGVKSPILESTPTTEAILDPIFNMMPRTTTIQAISGSCPRFTFGFFNHTFNFDFICTLLDSQASTISAIMLFAFTVKTILIILSA